jgi:hypothetical protein
MKSGLFVLLILFLLISCATNKNRVAIANDEIVPMRLWQMIPSLPKMKKAQIFNMCKSDPSFYKDDTVLKSELVYFKQENDYQNIFINSIGYNAFVKNVKYPVGTVIYLEKLNLETKRIDIDLIRFDKNLKWIIFRGMSTTHPNKAPSNVIDD